MGFEPTHFRTGAWNQRLRPFGHTALFFRFVLNGWPCGPTNKASDYESGDCRFESCKGQYFSLLSVFKIFRSRVGSLWISFYFYKKKYFKKVSMRMWFEPTRAESFGVEAQGLNHSATSSHWIKRQENLWYKSVKDIHNVNKIVKITEGSTGIWTRDLSLRLTFKLS